MESVFPVGSITTRFSGVKSTSIYFPFFFRLYWIIMINYCISFVLWWEHYHTVAFENRLTTLLSYCDGYRVFNFVIAMVLILKFDVWFLDTLFGDLVLSFEFCVDFQVKIHVSLGVFWKDFSAQLFAINFKNLILSFHIDYVHLNVWKLCLQRLKKLHSILVQAEHNDILNVVLVEELEHF